MFVPCHQMTHFEHYFVVFALFVFSPMLINIFYDIFYLILVKYWKFFQISQHSYHVIICTGCSSNVETSSATELFSHANELRQDDYFVERKCSWTWKFHCFCAVYSVTIKPRNFDFLFLITTCLLRNINIILPKLKSKVCIS